MSYELVQEEDLLLKESLEQLEFGTLLEFISKYSSSDLGREIIRKTEPIENLFWLQKEHNMLDEMVRLLTEDEMFPFDYVADIRPKLHKSTVVNAVLMPGEMVQIKEVIRTIRLVKNYFSFRTEKFPNLYEESSFLFDNRLLEKHIEDTIGENDEVRDTATKELAQIRRELIEKSGRLRSRMQKILQKVSDDELVQDEFVSLREGRFVLPIKSEHKRHIPGIIHGVSQTGATVFVEPSEVIEMNNELSLLFSEEKREVYRILTNLTAEIGADASKFLASMETIAHFDAILGKAKYALEFGGIKPIIHENNDIFCSNIRHPLLVHTKGTAKVKPVSVEFDLRKRGHLVSGPNAGGKTVALKSIGINLIMALSGIFPLGECHTNYRRIYTSIGDHQSIANDLSTFSSQILQIKKILSYCNNESLVLIDEICSGTDPQEGAALAAGILDTFIEMNLFFVVTTHQSSLKTYALIRKEIENDSMEFDEKRLSPTYNFLQGIPGNSYAFVLSESLGLSKLVLERARQYLGSHQTELEESISILQRYKNEAEELKIGVEQEKIKAEKYRVDYEQKLSEIKKKRAELVAAAKSEALDIVQRANAMIENTIKEIREEKKQISEIKETYHKVRTELEEDVKKLENFGQPPKPDISLKEGDTVALDDSPSQTGTVIEANESKKIAVVELNGMKFSLPYSQLVKCEPKPETKREATEYIKFNAETRIDLRGKRADESIREVDFLINEALMSNVDMLTIIHGKGTGALRAAIHQFLKSHPSVVSFRVGSIVEGGDGVTVVQL